MNTCNTCLSLSQMCIDFISRRWRRPGPGVGRAAEKTRDLRHAAGRGNRRVPVLDLTRTRRHGFRVSRFSVRGGRRSPARLGESVPGPESPASGTVTVTAGESRGRPGRPRPGRCRAVITGMPGPARAAQTCRGHGVEWPDSDLNSPPPASHESENLT
jgi:hypothetical protein